MKRIYMALAALVFAATGAMAQKNIDLSVQIYQPDSNYTYPNVATGDTMTYAWIITNNGEDDVVETDTIVSSVYGHLLGSNGTYYYYPYTWGGFNIPAGTSDTVGVYVVQGTQFGTAGTVTVNEYWPTNDTGGYYVWVYGYDQDNNYFTDNGVDNDSLAAGSSLGATDNGGNNFSFNWAVFGTPGTTGVGNIAGLPKESLNVYPNPVIAGSALNIKYAFTAATNASIRVTDISGRTLITKNLGKQGIGEKTFNLSLNSLASGNYFVELVTDSKRAIAQVVLNK